LDPVGGRGPNLVTFDLPTPLGFSDLSLSPGGKNIALVRETDNIVYLVNLESRTVRQLELKNWKFFQTIRWSTDGQHLYISGLSSTDSWAIFLADLAGNINVLVEIEGGQGWLCCPKPSPDGHFLVYSERIYDTNVSLLEKF
jgi:Tol biopolymer transport system component